jgi:hypothetical protein
MGLQVTVDQRWLAGLLCNSRPNGTGLSENGTSTSRIPAHPEI